MPDKDIECVDCHGWFIFTEDEQRFWKDMKFQHDPKRCRSCRKNKRQHFDNKPAKVKEFGDVWNEKGSR